MTNSSLRLAVETIRALEQRLVAVERERSSAESVAIIGASCRLPKCSGVEDLWELLSSGGDAIEDVAFGDAGIVSLGRVDGLEDMDAAFFQIGPREAFRIDPRQRLVLEVSWEALERAGIRADAISQPVGVYIGASGFTAPLGEQGDAHDVTGALASVIAGRVSHAFGLRGPSLTVDTACSSALVALHLACRALRACERDVALSKRNNKAIPGIC